MNDFFKSHEIDSYFTNEDYNVGYYVVKNPTTSVYWFQITYSPGMFTLSGDCYELMVNKPIGWLSKETIKSTDYFLEKVVNREQYLQFSMKKANDFIEEIEKEGYTTNARKIALDDLRDCLENISGDLLHPKVAEYQFLEAASFFIEDRDYPDLLEPTDRFKFQMQALTRFCELLKESIE